MEYGTSSLTPKNYLKISKPLGIFFGRLRKQRNLIKTLIKISNLSLEEKGRGFILFCQNQNISY